MRILNLAYAGLLLAALLASACSYDNGTSYRPVGNENQYDNDVVYQADIDTDAKLTDAVAGEGVGVMIEYAAGGTWQTKFTCDTSLTQLECHWYLEVLTLDGSNLSGIDIQKLGSTDALERYSSSQVGFDLHTTYETDEVSFQTTAGIPVGFYVWLDGEPSPNRYVFWKSGGWLNKGISGTSFDLYPTSP